jgi:hypothetical protein
MNRITRSFLTVTVTAAVAAVSASAALADPPQGHGASGRAQGDVAFIPGVTDFPARPATNTVTVSVLPAGGFDWSDAGIGAGAVALAVLLAAAAVAVLRRRSRTILGTAGAVLGVAVIAASAGGALTLNHSETVLRG